MLNFSLYAWVILLIGIGLIALSLFFLFSIKPRNWQEPFKPWVWFGRFALAGLLALLVGGVLWPVSVLVLSHMQQSHLWKPYSPFLFCLDGCILLGGGLGTWWVLQHAYKAPHDLGENDRSPWRLPWNIGFALLQSFGLLSPAWLPPSFPWITLVVLLFFLASVCLGVSGYQSHSGDIDLRSELRLLISPLMGLVLGIVVLAFGLLSAT